MPNAEEIIATGKTRPEHYRGWDYLRLAEDCKDLPRGTLIADRRIIYGYPHIGRLLALQPGLREQFTQPFWVEEKVDGYNVRIARLNGLTLAFTRGGYVCPYTTDRLPDLLDLSVFDHEPELVICAEVAGPDNPYLESSPAFVTRDVQLFVFDCLRLDRPDFLPPPQTYALAERHRLPTVQHYGRHAPEDNAALLALLRRLDTEQREGVVFKEEAPQPRRAKYVTGSANLQDIEATATDLLDLPPEYFTGRILRLALFLKELGLEQGETIQRRLGSAFLDGLLRAMRQYESEQRCYTTFRCRLRSRDNALALLTHLDHVTGHKVQIVQRDLREENDGYWMLEFDRSYPALNGLLSHLRHGGLIFD